MPISRPFRVGSELCHAFEFGMLHWRSDLAAAEQIDMLEHVVRAVSVAMVDELYAKVVHWLQPSGRHRGRDHLSQIRTSVL